MRNFFLIPCLIYAPGFAAAAGHYDALSYSVELSLTASELDDVSFGGDPDVERSVEEELELAFSIEYQAGDRLYFIFGGSLIDETEEVEPRGARESLSGFERGEMGIGYLFGENVESEIRAGRQEFVNLSHWWYWWDEDLDSISLNSRSGKYEFLVAVAEEQAREVSDMDRIDPELEDVRRVLANFDWEFADGQFLQLYYLDQEDGSSSQMAGDFVDEDRIDEEDTDLTWTGVSYLGWFEHDNLGEFEVELAWAHVGGRETVYEFDDPADGRAEVEEITRQRVSGDAYGVRVDWTPARFDDFTLFLAHARGSGDDPDKDDGVDDSFRQTGLQGEADIFGELYQPELSNLIVDTVGIKFSFDDIDIELLHHDYRQDEAAGEMRDVAIEADTEGAGKSLGSEIDLILTFDVYDVEIELIAAEFEAGDAYGEFGGESSRYWQVELTYVF